MKKDFILFDLDGTLTDPALGITNSLIYALTFFGIKIEDRTSLFKYIGPPLLDTFSQGFGFDKGKSDKALLKYREYFSTKGLFENKVYEGIPEMLQTLVENGKTLIVATSKPEEYSVSIMKHFNLDKYFLNICGSCMDETRSKKAEVIEYALEKSNITDKSKVIMIGDRKHDIIGAKENGLESCGVLYGYGSQEELEGAGADFIAPTIQDLQKILLG